MSISSPLPVITAEQLSIGYDAARPVIQQFTAMIGAGQFIGVFGSNGAGKTTLLRCLLGLLPPLSGTLDVLGKAPKHGHQQVGYLPQALPHVPINVSGRALLSATVAGSRLGIPWLSKTQRQDIERAIEFVGAGNLVDRPFRQLSGGEQRRLLLAQALLGQPRLLLLDEPLANLDPHHQHTLISLLSRVQQELGITVLLTAHDLNPLLNVMSQVLYLARGKAVIGDVDQVVTNEVLSKLYDSPIEVIRQQGRVFVIHSRTGQAENVACH
jgi:zinc/manganese transport system ATP-binding protein